MPASKDRIAIPIGKQTHYIREDIYPAFSRKSHGNKSDAAQGAMLLWLCTTPAVREKAIEAALHMPLPQAAKAVRQVLAAAPVGSDEVAAPEAISAALSEHAQDLQKSRLPGKGATRTKGAQR